MEYTLSADAMTVQLLGTDDNRIFLFCEASGVELETDNPDVTLQDTYQVVCFVEKAELSSETPVAAMIWP
jgi:phosphate starvation-inducible protein PhoH